MILLGVGTDLLQQPRRGMYLSSETDLVLVETLLVRRHLHKRRWRCDADDLISSGRRAASLAHRIDRHVVVCARGRRDDELLTNHLIE